MNTHVSLGAPDAAAEEAEEVGESSSNSEENGLRRAFEHAVHLLPAQGPIAVFIHHNTLHAFEHLPFAEGVARGFEYCGGQPYLSEERYRRELTRGRMVPADIAVALANDPESDDRPLPLGCTRRTLRATLLAHPTLTATPAELRWLVAGEDALRRFRADIPSDAKRRLIQDTRHWVLRDLRGGRDSGQLHRAAQDVESRRRLDPVFRRFDRRNIEQWSESTWTAFSLQAAWHLCRSGVDCAEPRAKVTSNLPEWARLRDGLLATTGVDSDLRVHDLLIRFCGAFLDQGVARWTLPGREQGFRAAFTLVHGGGIGPVEGWRRTLGRELRRLEKSRLSTWEWIAEELHALALTPADWQNYITATLLALRGWAGMIHQLETRPDRAVRPIRTGALAEFLAVRLLLDRLAALAVADEFWDFTGSPARLLELCRARISPAVDDDNRAFAFFQVSQLMGWAPPVLARLTPEDWRAVFSELEAFGGLDRRRIFHAAYERNYRVRTLDALAIHARAKPIADSLPTSARPPFQVITCLDEREESLRRHVEELAPACETFGAAGFFGVAMYFRAADAAHFVPLCPVVTIPKHFVAEVPAAGREREHTRERAASRLIGHAAYRVHMGSRHGSLVSLLLSFFGVVATIPLVLRVLFPRLTTLARRFFDRLVRPDTPTRLLLQRDDTTGEIMDETTDEKESNTRTGGSRPAVARGKEPVLGFTLAEQAEIGERLLRDIGLTENFARLVVVLGHGSFSLNNPHQSAYNCGACGGSPGAPNARALAEILNSPTVRLQLSKVGIPIPVDTFFIGGCHNTSDDSLEWADVDRTPPELRAALEKCQTLLETACTRNAHERCRRFLSAPLDITEVEARRHVEGRAADLAQVRPELGHATNALCVVGRRVRTRGLFMDRRAFLVSYNPLADDNCYSILTRVLAAIVPVCGGINLEYYFSHVDCSGWGCGTKLPHNITALLGVMDGAASDLRPGLPWQMVEMHEPMRLLVVVEANPVALLDLLSRNPAIEQPFRQHWLQLAALEPDAPQLHLYQDGVFQPYMPETAELPVVASSVDWYRGWRDHLGYATVEAHP